MAKNKLTVDKDDLKQFIEAVIQKYVNGKIDRIAAHLTKQDNDIAEIRAFKPLLEGLQTTKTTTRVLMRVLAWMFGGAVSIGSAYLLFNQIFHFIK